MRGKDQSIHEYIAERTDLAQIYADDGAFYTAAKILSELATEVKRHANEVLPPVGIRKH
jgi:hypothetical protein